MTMPWKKLLGSTKVPNVTDVKAAVGWSATAGIGALYFIQVRCTKGTRRNETMHRHAWIRLTRAHAMDRRCDGTWNQAVVLPAQLGLRRRREVNTRVGAIRQEKGRAEESRPRRTKRHVHVLSNAQVTNVPFRSHVQEDVADDQRRTFRRRLEPHRSVTRRATTRP